MIGIKFLENYLFICFASSKDLTNNYSKLYKTNFFTYDKFS